MSIFLCPCCGRPLQQDPAKYYCPKGHVFDRSKSGYVNLLLPNSKHSKLPGDNKLMVAARRNFLSKGYYQPLAELICKIAEQYFQNGDILLDVGCGEGYYTNQIQRHLNHNQTQVSLSGIDISKFALDKAAKQNKAINYAVASAFHLPVDDHSCNGVFNLFAPYCGEELLRVLRPDGYMILAVPGKEHLWELKQAVYQQPYKNEVKDTILQGFHLIEQQNLCYQIHLEEPELIDSLFKMTPYYYKTSIEDYQRLASLKELTVTVEFHLFVYQSNLK